MKITILVAAAFLVPAPILGQHEPPGKRFAGLAENATAVPKYLLEPLQLAQKLTRG